MLCTYSVILAAVIAGLRINRIDPLFYPFILLIWRGLMSEIVSMFIVQHHQSNAVNANVYVLLESLIIVWQFHKWKLFGQNAPYAVILMSIYILVWIADNFILSRIIYFNSYFRILYSFVTVLLSISMVNKLIFSESKTLLRSPIFLIMIAFIVYYTYKVLVEAFWIYGLNSSDHFRISVYNILHVINLISNLLYALAVVWIPKKKEFLRLS